MMRINLFPQDSLWSLKSLQTCDIWLLNIFPSLILLPTQHKAAPLHEFVTDVQNDPDGMELGPPHA